MMNETSIFQWLFRSDERKKFIESIKDNKKLTDHITNGLLLWGIVVGTLELLFSSPFSVIRWLTTVAIGYSIWELVPLLIFSRWLSVQSSIGALINILTLTTLISYLALGTASAINHLFINGILLSISFYTHLSYEKDVS